MEKRITITLNGSDDIHAYTKGLSNVETVGLLESMKNRFIMDKFYNKNSIAGEPKKKQMIQYFPFDLDKALAGEQVMTKYGYKVNNVRIAGDNGIWADINGDTHPFDKKGKHVSSSGEYDLFMVDPESKAVEFSQNASELKDVKDSVYKSRIISEEEYNGLYEAIRQALDQIKFPTFLDVRDKVIDNLTEILKNKKP